MAALRTAGAGAAASAPAGQQEALDASLPDQAPPAIPHALLLALIGMDDAGLRREFDAHALAADDKGERRMSKAGLASFMHAQGLAHGDAEVERFLVRVDANNDGEIDFSEFRALARAGSDLEKVLQSKRLECILCAFFPRGTTLEDLATMERSQFGAIVDLSKPALVQLLVDLAAQMAAVGKAQGAAGGGKFTLELKGGLLDDFYKGVTGVCGEPDADIEKGMREEHTERPDSHVEFSTPNYGITTTPAKEWALVLESGSGRAKVEVKEGSVSVTSTRGCCKASGLRWLNTGNADPTILGLKWQAVGDTQPTEGRQLTNSMLSDALASTAAAAEEPSSSSSTWDIFLLLGEEETTNKARLTKVIDFSREDLDSFGVTDLRSTDFIEAGGSYFKPIAITAQILANPLLADGLMQKTEFTQQEWDSFGVCDLGMHHFVKSDDSFFQPAGTEAQADVRVLRPIAHYGDFGADGRLKWGVGDEVVVGEAFTVTFEGKDELGSKKEQKKELAKDTEGQGLEFNANCYVTVTYGGKKQQKKEIAKDTEGAVLDFNAEGAANIEFRESRVVGRGEIDFAWATYSPRDKAVADMDVVLCAPEKADADIENSDQLLGKMAVVYRGECSLQKQTERLIAAGAHGVIIINTEDNLFEAPPADEGYSAAIPVVMIKAKDAAALLACGNSSCLGKVIVLVEHWVTPDQFYCLYPRPSARDTPIQRMVKLGRLRRCDVFALVLYTGPMYVLLNAILRGFGFCGAVAPDTEFASDEFWSQWKAVDINAWRKRSGHKFTNTIHALASAIKKLQGLAAQEPSTRLYRGLDGLDVAAFAASWGFTDKAFMSMTEDRRIALEYSGVNKGLVGTVLCTETSTTNNGAVIVKFSQYPGEKETVWNACSFLQHLHGREEVVLPQGGGVVRIYHVLASANSRAETVEELEGRRKRVVVKILDTLHADVCRAVDDAAKMEEFEKRVAQDREKYDSTPQYYKNKFMSSIKDESAERVAVYKSLPDAAFAAIEVLGEVVSKSLALPLLANAKLRLFLEDQSLDLDMMGRKDHPAYLGLNAAQGRRLAKRRLLLQDSSGTAALALEDCCERRLVTGAGDAALERKDPYTHETPLIAQVQLGESENVKRLLQAGADPNAATAGGERALLIAAKEGREDLVGLLADFKAEVNVRYAQGKTALHWASQEGHLAAVQALLKAGADTEAKDKDYGWTSLHQASVCGHAAVVQTLLERGADVGAIDQRGETALDWAKNDKVKAILRRAVLEDVRRKAEEAGEDADEAVRLEEEMDA
jgi:hypothetical protein